MVGAVLLPRPASGWQSNLVGITGDGFNRAQGLDVVLAPDHELVVVGSNHFVIAKLAAATGDEIWRHDLGPGAAVATAVDAAGDVVAAGAYLPLAVPVTVQLRRTDGSGPCWSAVHDFVVRNRTDRFVAEGN